MSDPAPVLSPHIKDTSDQAFAADVVEASGKQPVLVDFWAPWCGPCRSLTPVLEHVVASRNGQIKLAKINIEDNPGIAGQLGVRSIPAVFAFDKGRAVNGFQGALPENQIQKFIDTLLEQTDSSTQFKQNLEQAEQALESGDIPTAAQIYSELIAMDPVNTEAIVGLARCYLLNGDATRARQTLTMVPADKQSDPALQSVQASLELLTTPVHADDTDNVHGAYEHDPNDPGALYTLAEKLAAQGHYKDAANHLLAILACNMNWEDGKAKAKLLHIFKAAGPKSPITREGRRQLSSLLFP